MDKRAIIKKIKKRMMKNLILPGALMGFFALFVLVFSFVLPYDDEVIIPFVIFCVFEGVCVLVFALMVRKIIGKINVIKYGQEIVAEYISHTSNMSINNVAYYSIRYRYYYQGTTVEAKTGSHYLGSEAETLRNKRNLKIMHIGTQSVLIDEGAFVSAAPTVDGERESALFGKSSTKTVSHEAGQSGEELFSQMVRLINQANSRAQMETIIERHSGALSSEIRDRLAKRVNYLCKQRGYDIYPAEKTTAEPKIAQTSPETQQEIIQTVPKVQEDNKAEIVEDMPAVLPEVEADFEPKSFAQPDFTRSFGGFDKPDYAKPDFSFKPIEKSDEVKDGKSGEEKKSKNKWDSFYE